MAMALVLAGCDDDTTPVDGAAPDLSASKDLAGGKDLSMMGDAAPPMMAGVTIGDDFFQDADVTIAKGGTVTWTWTGVAPHTVTSGSGTPDGIFCSAPGTPSTATCAGAAFAKTTGTYSFTFTNAGTFSYYCGFHGFAMMHGTVTVLP
jgi:plastocyanin